MRDCVGRSFLKIVGRPELPVLDPEQSVGVPESGPLTR